MSKHRGRKIPWLSVVKFHKEIVARAEQGFFSLNGSDDQDTRWTSLSNFDPEDLAGPWQIDREVLRSRQFLLTLEQDRHESVFIGGPCYLGYTKSSRGTWLPQWRPLLYREVELRLNEGSYDILPKQGSWSVTPLIYNLFDRLEVQLGVSYDDFAARLIEKAAGYREHGQIPLGRSIFRALFSEVPDVEEEIKKQPRNDTFSVQPSPWILFAPTSSFSAFTRYLVQDYGRLETLLQKDGTKIGGLRLLEDKPAPKVSKTFDMLPFVPLTESQRRAVQAVLEERPLSVISGPPGTGKSQVVVSILLNAWARGRTVLFASNNNKAVDVVRERVERFESEFPIAVRAGSKQKQNIQEVLRRTLNMASAEKISTSRDSLAKLKRRRKKLLDEQAMLQMGLDSHLPQRIDEARKTALNAYGEYRSHLAKIEEIERHLRNEQTALGFKAQPLSKLEETLSETQNWINSIADFQELVRLDSQRHSDLQNDIISFEMHRNRAVEEIGLSMDDVGDWQWLFTGPKPELLAEWEQRIRVILGRPLEQSLEAIEWQMQFDRWESAQSAEEWAEKARKFAEIVLQTTTEISPKLLSVRELKRAVENCRSKLAPLNIPEDVDPSIEALREWTANYSELATHETGRLDFLPWSKPSRLRKELSRIEQQLRPGFQLELWTRIGVLNDEGRQKLAPIIEATRQWLDLRKKREEANELINLIIVKFQELRSKASVLKLSDIPTKADTEAWKLIISQCEGSAKIADQAAVAWRKRTEKEEVEEILRKVAKEWVQIASGVPIWEGWRRNHGKNFDEALIFLADHPNSQNVVKARSVFYSGALGRLIECWQAIFNYEKKAFQLRLDLNEISKPSDRLIEWWRNRPLNACVLDRKPSDWPELEKPLETIRNLSDWCLRWNEFTKVTRPDEEAKAQEELEWAVSKLKQAISVLPDTSERTRITDIYTTIKRKPGDNWPIPDLNEAFAGFGSDRIRAKIQHTRAKLEKESFDYAKANWVERLLSDDDSIRAVDTLEQSLQQNRGQIIEAHYETFRDALRTVPIWITTAQAANAIPLEPEIFDIVVIDEASQCTLTNLLPLMYRGRTLVVIGDDNQLPAIPTIQETEELGLARKYDIEAHLPLLGHYSNNVYKAAVESLPRRRADVIMLVEHFRSHPQIIGFSNRHIYSQRLELKKDPNWGKRLPVGSGVHAHQIVGVVRRGKNGRSWMNMPEAEAVVELVQQLRVGDSRSLRLGIVTPFVAQKEAILDKLDALELRSDILVDTAYGFQGDERDVIIFSPVVGRGMTVSATLWVETPPNLINVAITRAREAFFFVGDLDFCLQLKGILRKLALYCREIQLLRKTSPAELELFSWMVVKGWDPQIHLRIGDIEVDFTLQARNGIRLAIEVDGRQYHEGTKEQDKARDAFLYAQGYDVLRATAREVLETPFEVIHQIEQRLLAQ